MKTCHGDKAAKGTLSSITSQQDYALVPAMASMSYPPQFKADYELKPQMCLSGKERPCSLSKQRKPQGLPAAAAGK